MIRPLKSIILTICISFIGVVVFSPSMSVAQEAAAEETETEKPKEEEKASKSKKKKKKDDDEEDKETLEEVTKDFEKLEGLFTLYRDPENGALHMEIASDQIDKEFIYHALTVDGPADLGFNYTRGSYLANDVISIRKHYETIEIYKEVTSFYYDPESPMSRAARVNQIPSLIATATITAKSEDETRYLIEADPLFVSEALTQISPSPSAEPPKNVPFSIGGFNPEKSKTLDVRSYPKNANVTVALTYDSSTPMNYGSDEIVDARSVTINVQHSFIAMPDDGFRPRFDDQRVGYFYQRVTDLTSADFTPYRDLIDRWRLVKKDPEAEISEPVTPITYWIENTTPLEYREAIKKGTLAWNAAFEKVGFKNAIVVNIQPDDAEWDAGDIEYNVIRWVSSPQPMYSGMGPSITNPRTGEIIGTDIMLEYISVSFILQLENSFDIAAMPALAPPEGQESELNYCSAGLAMQSNVMFGRAVLQSQNASEAEVGEFLEQSLISLAAHEVGHTLGLMHNFRASYYQPIDRVFISDVTKADTLSASVMDYETANLSKDRSVDGHYFTMQIGPYDHWAIEYGYSQSEEDEELEQTRLAEILARSTEPGHAFANDADDMRYPGKGIDPRAMIFDMSADPISYAIDRASLVKDLLSTMAQEYDEEGATWHGLRTSYLYVSSHTGLASMVLSRYIGGVYVERQTIGQPGQKQPFTAVAYADQKRAMLGLRDHIFAPDAFDMPVELIARLQMQRRGQQFWPITEDPKIHDRALGIQNRALAHVMHPVVMKRLTDSRLYGNEYSVAEMLGDLTDAIFEEDLKGPVNTYRQNLQMQYVQRLTGILFGAQGYDQISQSAAHYNLRRIERMMRQGARGNLETQAHRRHVRALVENVLYGEPSR